MVQHPKLRRLAVIYGDQLDAAYLKTLKLDPEKDGILMMEVASASKAPASHWQRTVTFLTAMRHHAAWLRRRGFFVRYVDLAARGNTHHFEGEILRAVKVHRPTGLTAIAPGSWHALEALRRSADQAGLPCTIEEDPHFLCTVREFADWSDGRKELVLEFFYREMRRRHGVLMEEGGGPVGGKWNYDKDNRKAFREAPAAPTPPRFRTDDVFDSVVAAVDEHLPGLPGRTPAGKALAWPVKRSQALRGLNAFLEERLPHFGDYQDAMWAGEDKLYHSLLSVALNLKLLSPREVIAKAVARYENKTAPLNAVEGFVRQILGWREFVRGVYWTQGESYGARNELGQKGQLPEFYWDGDTEMVCIREAVRSVLDHSYGHHIARLMLTGNFALIAGVDPQAVNDWYLGMYADGVEWVTTPNVIGMALHADGGVVGTKPYAASGKYIDRMGNYCQDCEFDVRKRLGVGACPFNVFYWDFLLCHRDRFAGNRRMAMILKNLDRMTPVEISNIQAQAVQLRDRFGIQVRAVPDSAD